jgi:hypothetical protein
MIQIVLHYNLSLVIVLMDAVGAGGCEPRMATDRTDGKIKALAPERA